MGCGAHVCLLDPDGTAPSTTDEAAPLIYRMTGFDVHPADQPSVHLWCASADGGRFYAVNATDAPAIVRHTATNLS
jgi:hypothetical protein